MLEKQLFYFKFQNPTDGISLMRFVSSFCKKSIHLNTNELSPRTTVIDGNNSNLLIKKWFRSLQHLVKASKLNNKFLSKDWCYSFERSKGSINVIMDKNKPKVKPTVTSKIKRSSLLSASVIANKANIDYEVGMIFNFTHL